MDGSILDIKENVGASQGMEHDELAGLPVTKRPQVTPRNSMAAQEAKPTPHANLRALAGLIRRPSTPGGRRASSIGKAFSASKTASHTPALQPRTTPRIRRPLQPAGPNGSNPTTPHTSRALQQRRATPGRDKRKSGLTQRETPRDALRNLSKILAKTSQPTRPSPVSAQSGSGLLKQQEVDEFEDELSPEQPKFTIAVDNDGEDESSLMDRPRLSMPLEEGEQTAKSIEMPRRASVGDERRRLSRGSLGSIPASEKVGRLWESGIDNSHGDAGEDHQWQDVEDEIPILTGARDSGGDLRRLIRETLEQSDELSSSHLGQSPHTAAFSPFELKIPDMEPRDQFPPAPAYDSLPEDDILQFGTPLPRPDPLKSHSLPPTIVQRPTRKAGLKSRVRVEARKPLKVSRHGISYSGLPVGITKSIATTFARSTGKKTVRLNKETMTEILQASDEFFEQLGGDLRAVSSHAGRKTIDESDVIAIMQRQRQVSVRATAFSLASRYLPGEILKEMRMPIPKPYRQQRKRALEDIAEDTGEEDA